jgi:hypothetical protein
MSHIVNSVASAIIDLQDILRCHGLSPLKAIEFETDAGKDILDAAVRADRARMNYNNDEDDAPLSICHVELRFPERLSSTLSPLFASFVEKLQDEGVEVPGLTLVTRVADNIAGQLKP